MRFSKRELRAPRFLYRYRPFDDKFGSVRKALAENRWWFGSRRRFDDQQDLICPGIDLDSDPRLKEAIDAEQIGSDVQKVLDSTGILCLAKSPKSPMMWQLYAAEGAGVCIRLESDYVTKPGYGPFKVVYSEKPKAPWRLRASRDAHQKQTTQALLQKGTEWAYQFEWRCIRTWPEDGAPTADRYYPLSERALVGLIFGWAISREDREEMLGWIGAGGWMRQLEARDPARRLKLEEARLLRGRIELSNYQL